MHKAGGVKGYMLGFVAFRVEGVAKCGTPLVQYDAPFAGCVK